MNAFKFNVFGRLILVTEKQDGWATFYLGADGKKRPAKDVIIAPDTKASEIALYLGDLCHEWASEQNPSVEELE